MRTIVILGDASSKELEEVAAAVVRESKPLNADDHLHKVTKTDLSKAVVLNEAHSSDRKEISANIALR